MFNFLARNTTRLFWIQKNFKPFRAIRQQVCVAIGGEWLIDWRCLIQLTYLYNSATIFTLACQSSWNLLRFFIWLLHFIFYHLDSWNYKKEVPRTIFWHRAQEGYFEWKKCPYIYRFSTASIILLIEYY